MFFYVIYFFSKEYGSGIQIDGPFNEETAEYKAATCHEKYPGSTATVYSSLSPDKTEALGEWWTEQIGGTSITGGLEE